MGNTHILLLPLYLKIDSHIKANFNILKHVCYLKVYIINILSLDEGRVYHYSRSVNRYRNIAKRNLTHWRGSFKRILSFERKVWNLIKNLWLSDIWFRGGVLNFGPKNEVINPYMVLQRELFLCCRVVTTFSLWLITMQQPSLSCTWHSLKSLQSHGFMVSYFIQWSIIFYTLYIVLFFFMCAVSHYFKKYFLLEKKKNQQFFVSSNNNIVYQTIDMFPFHF